MEQRYPGYNPNQQNIPPGNPGVIRNPTPQDLAKAKAESQAQIEKAKYVAQPVTSNGIPTEGLKSVSNSTLEKTMLEELHVKYGVPMKLIEDFEPDPVPYKLTTGNKVVQTGLTPNGEIFVRRFSTEEESKIASIKISNDFTTTVNEIINSCIKSDISVSAFSEIDKIPLFLFLMGLSYGGKINVGPIKGCPTCTDSTVVEIDIKSDLNIAYVPEDYEYPLKVKLNSIQDGEIVFHFPRIMNENIMFENQKSQDFSKQIRELALEINGKKKNGQPIQKQEWELVLKYLDNVDKAAITSKINEFSKFGIVLTMKKYECSKGKDCEQIAKNKEIPLDLEKVMFGLRNKISEVQDGEAVQSLF